MFIALPVIIADMNMPDPITESFYEGKKVVGSDIADEVKLIDFVSGKSTTNLIEKISKRC